MVDVYKLLKPAFFVFCVLVSVILFSPKASAFGIDFLGEVAQPIIAPAKEKMKGVLVYIWLQPYGGYAWGTNDQKRIAATGAITSANGEKTEGLLYGGRGGILLLDTFRLGLDYSAQSLKRNTLVEGTSGTYSVLPVRGTNTMLGLILGMDLPYTPLQGFVTKYFKASVSGDTANSGDGWGGGVSFVLKNPFILSVESRKLNYSSGVADATGKKAQASIKQYYVTLSFMLL